MHFILSNKVDSTKVPETINNKNIIASEKLKMEKQGQTGFILMFMLNNSRN